MKKALKIFGIVVGVVLLLVAAALTYFSVKGIPTYEVNAPDLTVTVDSASVARGAYIANVTCVHCHKGEDGKLSGKLLEEDGDFGTIFVPNITQHPDAGIGAYTDGELAFLLRTGIRKNGKFTVPMMTRFPNLSDEDLEAIIAFLRSDDPLVQPSEKVQPEFQPNLLAKILLNVAMKPLPFPEATVSAPDPSDQVAHGKYMATAMIPCYHCHSESFETVDDLVPENTPGYFGGRNPLPDPTDHKVITLSSNLTMHPEFGLGSWTGEEFANAVRFGQRNDGTSLNPAMPTFSSMSDEDVNAIWAYLKTLPVVDKNDTVLAGN